MARKRKWVKFNKEFSLDKIEEVFAELRSYLKEFDIDLDKLKDSDAVEFYVMYQQLSGSFNFYTDSIKDIENRLIDERENGYFGNVDYKISLKINLEELAKLN